MVEGSASVRDAARAASFGPGRKGVGFGPRGMLCDAIAGFCRAPLLRFGAVGLVNTTVCYGVILALLAAGSGDIPANLAGYATGLATSFTINKRWTFAGRGPATPGAAWRFALVFLLAYATNLAFVLLARRMGFVDDPLVHLLANGPYSLVFYLGSSGYVFAEAGSRRRGARP